MAMASASCVHRRHVPTAPVLDERGVAELVGPTAVDREGWANDIVVGIRMANREPTAERACAPRDARGNATANAMQVGSLHWRQLVPSRTL